MKFLEANIYGFGKWVDFTIPFTNQTLLAIYGENESGKTTIQQFILFMLFGLPPRERKRYQPKTSGKMGGRLTVLDPEVGEFTIERLGDSRNGAARCFTSDGKEYPEEWLKERLAGIDKKTYQSIFSFSALDLSKIQEIKEDDISEVLLGIGLTGSTKIQTIERQLEQRLADYFKPFGKNPTINQQLRKLDQISRELTQLKQEEATYREKKQRSFELEAEIEQLSKKIKLEKETLRKLERMLQALPQVEEYITYQQRLSVLPDEISFPQDGLARLQFLKDKMLPLQSEMKINKRTIDNLLQEKEELQAINHHFPISEAEELRTTYTDYEEIRRNLLNIEKQRNILEQEIQFALSELNIDISSEELAQLHLPFHLEKQWNDLRVINEQLALEKAKIEENIQLQQSKQVKIEKELADIQFSLLLPERKKELEDIIDSYKEKRLLIALQKENIHKQEEWKRTKEQTKKRIINLFVLSIIIGIVCGLLTAVTKNQLFINFTIVSIILGTIQWGLGKKSINNMDTMFREMSIPELLSEVSEQDKQKAENLLQTDEEYIREMEILQDKLRDCNLQLDQLHEKGIILKKKEEDILQKRLEQEKIYPFLSNVKLAFWSELYRSLKAITQLIKKLKEINEEKNNLQLKMDEYLYSVDQFFQKYSFDIKLQTVSAKLEFLTSKLEDYHDREKQINHKITVLNDTQNLLEELGIKCETIEGEIHSLMEVAQVESEEEFYQKSNDLLEKVEITNACEKIFAQFSSFFTLQEWNHIIDNPPKKSTIELEIEDLNQNIIDLENKLEEKRQHLARVKVEFQQLESSELYSETLHQFEREKEKLVNLARNWAVIKTAKELLVETKDNYRDKYLEKVLEKTSFFFRKLTDGHYQSVYAPIEDKPFTVERNDYLRFTVNELSQGTINQLYVSLRLAISDVMSQTVHLPFMIDDAFVHFDAQRNERMIHILKEFSLNHQILFFSCKQEIVKEFSDKNLLQLTKRIPLVEN